MILHDDFGQEIIHGILKIHLLKFVCILFLPINVQQSEKKTITKFVRGSRHEILR